MTLRIIQTQAAKILALEAERERNLLSITDGNNIINRLNAERDALNADALRYRWLREQNAVDVGFYVVYETPKNTGHVTWVGSDLDAAIDAAMR